MSALTVGPFTLDPSRPACTSCNLRSEWRDVQGRCPDCHPGWRESWREYAQAPRTVAELEAEHAASPWDDPLPLEGLE